VNDGAFVCGAHFRQGGRQLDVLRAIFHKRGGVCDDALWR
jgi:hypothetical protein